MQHHFDIEIAQQYGVNVAIFLNNMAFWIQKNVANNRHFHDGRCWTYNSVEAYSHLFPYWTQRQIGTVINHCISHGLILKGNFNNVQYDRTSWYALTDKAHKLLNIPILPKCKMDLTEPSNGFHQNVEPIPDINTNIKHRESTHAKKRVLLSESFQPNEDVTRHATAMGYSDEDLDALYEKFMTHYLEGEGKGRKYIDWQQKFKNWIETERKKPKEVKRQTNTYQSQGEIPRTRESYDAEVRAMKDIYAKLGKSYMKGICHDQDNGRLEAGIGRKA